MFKTTYQSVIRPLALGATLALAFALPASAEKVSFNTPDQLETKCNATGGTYLPPNTPDSSYECIGRNGSVVTCGGQGANAGTCSVIPRKGLALRLNQLKGDPVLGVLSAN